MGGNTDPCRRSLESDRTAAFIWSSQREEIEDLLGLLHEIGGMTMGDYISRDMAIARLTKVEVTNRLATMTDAKRVIAEMPAADVAPVVHGEWEAVDWREYDANSCEVICYPKDGIACTHCRYVFKKDALWKKNFCPNCGAKMDGGVDNAKSV